MDVDECNTNNSKCDQLCINEEGSYSCNCTEGYYLLTDGFTCEDVNECAHNNGGCDQVCTNVDGYFFCDCKDGFLMNNNTLSCEDVNECEVSNGGCEQDCINENGTFSCDCFQGYAIKFDNSSCVDINECVTNNGGCEQNCTNSMGFFSCSCYDGFLLESDGFACKDVIECDKDNGGCQQECINLEGSFSCSCKESYIINADGITCENVSQRSESSSLRARIDVGPIKQLKEPTIYHYISQQFGLSLQTYFKNFSTLSFSVVIRQLRKNADVQDPYKNDSIVVNYTVVYDTVNISSIRDSIIRGILGLNVWTKLLFDGHLVNVKLVNAPPVISPTNLLFSIPEDTPAGSIVGELTVQDPDNDIRGEIYVHSDDIPEEIKIGPVLNDKIQLVLEDSLDADKYTRSKNHGAQNEVVGPVVNFTVVVRDRPGLNASANVSLTIIDLNDNPPVCKPEEIRIKIPRDTKNGTDIYNLNAVCTDADYIFNRMILAIEEDSCNAFELTTVSLLLKSEIPDQFSSCRVTVNVTDQDNTLFHTRLAIRIKFQECAADVDYLNKAWKRGIPGKYTFGSCPDGYKGEAKRFCNKNAVYQEPVYNCTSAAIAEIFEKVFNENTSVSNILNDLANVTSPATSNKSLLIGDLEAVNKVMTKITQVIEVNQDNVKIVADSFIETANNILDESTTSSWTSMMNETGSGADAVLENLDSFAEKIANVSTTTGEIKVAKSNLFLKVGSTDACEGKEIQFPDRKEGDVPEWAGRTLDKVQIACTGNSSTESYSSVMYRNLSKILPSKVLGNSTGDKKLNAPVMSFSFFPKVRGKLVKPVEITFQLYNSHLKQPTCSFWMKRDRSVGGWSSDGCWLERFNKKSGTVVCKCDHLTNFAVLMSPSSPVSGGHHVALSTISMIGCILSMLCLFLTVGVHGYFWRVVKSQKSIINLNLACALFVAYLLFLAGVSRTENKGACTAIAVLLHLVYLAVFFIMLSEGLLLANTVLYPFSTRKPGIPLLISSYVLPVIIVAISMGAVQLEGYGNEKSCWLSTKNGLIWAFLVPVLIIILINLTIVTLVIRAMFGTAVLSKKTDKEKAMAGVRSIIILMPIMGLTWILGIFSVNEDTVVFQYLFALFNSIQGVLIFVFHSVLNKKIQNAFRKQRSKWQSLRSYDVSRSFATSTKSSKSTDESTSVM